MPSGARANDLNYPKDGNAWYYQARVGHEFEATDAPFAQLYVKNKRLPRRREAIRILLRAEPGALSATVLHLFLPSLRLDAAVTSSLRGYGDKETAIMLIIFTWAGYVIGGRQRRILILDPAGRVISPVPGCAAMPSTRIVTLNIGAGLVTPASR